MPQEDNKPAEVAADPKAEAAQAAREAVVAKWEDDFPADQLEVKYKPEADDAEKDDKPAPDDKGAGKTEEETPEVPETIVETPEPVVTLTDPGEYKAADYSFEVTLKDGKTVKVKTPEDAEALADDPDNFETPKQLLDFIKKTTSMQNKLDKDHDKWEAASEKFKTESEAVSNRNTQNANIEKEMVYLVAKGKLPKVPKEYVDANWNDPEVAKQPGVKEHIELLNYMLKENKLRAKADIQSFGPVDALTAMQADAAVIAAKKADKEAGETRKAAGARVAGVSPSSGTRPNAPQGIAVGRVIPFRGASVWDN